MRTTTRKSVSQSLHGVWMRRRGEVALRLLRAILTGMLSAGLVLLSPGGVQFAVGQEYPNSYDDAMTKLDELMRVVEDLRASIDRIQFDVEALALELAFEEPETIVEWVRSNIAYEPYRGVLRGAQGTLASRAGNAPDQAVLLATLLNDAGYEARIARGELLEADARELLRSVELRPFEPSDPVLGEEDLEAYDRAAAALAPSLPRPPSIDLNTLAEDADFLVAELESQLEGAGINWGGTGSSDLLLSEAMDYAWVEYRVDGAGTWTAVHPTFAPEESPGVTAMEVASGTIPASWQHRIRVTIGLDREVRGELEQEVLMEGWERPVAALGLRPLVTEVVPLEDLTLEAVLAGESSDLRSALFVPLFMDEPLGVAFDLQGVVAPLDAASSAAAGVVRQAGENVGAAAGAVGAFGGEPDGEAGRAARTLVDLWVRYELIRSDGGVTSIQRSLFEPVPPDHLLAPGVGVLPGHVTQVVSVATGSSDGPHAVDAVLLSVVDNRPLYEAMIAIAYGDATGLPPGLRDAQAAVEGHQVLSVFDRVLAGSGRFRHEPSVLIRQVAWQGLETMVNVSRLDIAHNAARQVQADADGVWVDRRGELRAGIVESLLEDDLHAMLLGVAELDSESAAEGLLARARLETAPLTIAPGDVGALQALELPDRVASKVASDVRSGNAVVLYADRDLQDLGSVAWWRISPSSGTSVAVADDGRGQDAFTWAELAVIASIIGGMLGVFTHGLVENCFTKPGPGGTGSIAERHEGEKFLQVVMQECGIAGKLLGATLYVWMYVGVLGPEDI